MYFATSRVFPQPLAQPAHLHVDRPIERPGVARNHERASPTS
jgi:hypothetical protein